MPCWAAFLSYLDSGSLDDNQDNQNLNLKTEVISFKLFLT